MFNGMSKVSFEQEVDRQIQQNKNDLSNNLQKYIQAENVVEI